jgi:putative endonuclease
MFYMYVLENTEGELYSGSTNNLKRRLVEHQSKRVFSTKKSEWRLIYYEAYYSETDAREREKQIKHHGQAWAQLKKRLIHSRRLES